MPKQFMYSFLIATAIVFCFTTCKPEKFDRNKYGNCADNIKNQNEQDVDCGGRCLPCGSCDDGIKNSGESGIDCGGRCVSCIPACSTNPGVVSFTLFPDAFPSGFKDGSAFTYNYFNKSSYQLDINFTGSAIKGITIQFQKDFYPFDVIDLNETMVFTTIGYSNFTISKRSNVIATYRTTFDLGSYTGTFKQDQSIHFTRISDETIQVRFCNLVGGNDKDEASLNVVVK